MPPFHSVHDHRGPGVELRSRPSRPKGDDAGWILNPGCRFQDCRALCPRVETKSMIPRSRLVFGIRRPGCFEMVGGDMRCAAWRKGLEARPLFLHCGKLLVQHFLMNMLGVKRNKRFEGELFTLRPRVF